MDVEFRFNKDDLETKEWLISVFNLSENDFLEIRPFDGTAIVIVVFIAIEALIKNPTIIDKFLKRDGCEVEFDEHGNLSKAKNMSASDIIKLKAHLEKQTNESE